MKIEKVISNNVVMTLLEDGQEALLMGKGIGYGKAQAEYINPDLVEKIFRLDNQAIRNQMEALLGRDNADYFMLTEHIVQYAQERLGRVLDQFIYIALTDHLAFAVNRFKQDIAFENPMSWEVKTLYKEEYQIGLWMLDCIEDQIGVRLPEGEAAFIALHIINASLGLDMNHTMNISHLTHELLRQIAGYFDLIYDEEAVNYLRLVTHLKFFAQRLFSQVAVDETEDDLSKYILQEYQREAACVAVLSAYIKEQYDYQTAIKEQAYLALHIHRILINA